MTLRLEGDGAPMEAETSFGFAVSSVDAERLRWYLEDFLEYPLDPAPAIAAQVERRLAELGTEIFAAVFDTDRDAQDVWAAVRGRLGELRVEVGGSVEAAAVLPWELLRDPRSDRPVALEAAAFVRVNPRPGTPARLPVPAGRGLRVLLVISRPAADADVPFRSVARHLAPLRGPSLRLDVLRPPTFAALTAALEDARRAGAPYQLVHFDGHGAYLDTGAASAGGYSPLRFGLLSPARPGRHGYLVFEDPDRPGNEQLVDGPALGALLARTGVGVLVLNACRSAYAEAPPEPRPEAVGDVHAEVRAYGSLALEATDAGLAGVVAMRYNVYVVTAAQFVADLYAALLAGQPLGEAVSAGRRRLAAQPNRSIAFEPRPLQDWSVPVVYEPAPLTLFHPSGERLRLTVAPAAGRAEPAAGLPRPPDAGFFGRDETLLALDRAFDRARVVLLHAYAGSGKTATAAEFARWYAGTGGLGDGAVLYSSLEQYTPLPRLLDQLADAFAPMLAADGVAWPALTGGERRAVALQLLTAVPVLWIWDNAEPVAGFPDPADSPWTAAEQRELADFLRDAATTRARVLVTSRRDERAWLGDLPSRVRLPAMPMRERIQLTKALARKHGHDIESVEDWRPLLRYSGGNPLTITLLVGQALRAGFTRRAHLDAFVERLRAGESDLDDDETQGRTRSLGAALSYGFATAFTDAERTQLAALAIFQDVVGIDVLVAMGNPDVGRLPELAGLDQARAATLLGRAADIGLLTAVDAGYYAMHPALPWYLRRLHPGATANRLETAFTTVMAVVGNMLFDWHQQGQEHYLALIRIEEANLLAARALAIRAARWLPALQCMMALDLLYDRERRQAEWGRLVDELVPALVDPDTGGPRTDIDEGEVVWRLLTGYRISLAREARDWVLVDRLQGLDLGFRRARADDALAVPPVGLDAQQRFDLRNLGIGEERWGRSLLERGDPACLTHFQAAVDIFQRIGDGAAEALIAHSIGIAHTVIDDIYDLDESERWYLRAIELTAPGDRLRRARLTVKLGLTALGRFNAGAGPDEDQQRHLDNARTLIEGALTIVPADATGDVAAFRMALGGVYAAANQVDAAIAEFQQAIAEFENVGERYRAGLVRQQMAGLLERDGRRDEALLYAASARRDFVAGGDGFAGEVEEIDRVIARLREA